MFKPFSGKLGLFSGIFTEYDMYLFAGLGLASFETPLPERRSRPPNCSACPAIRKDIQLLRSYAQLRPEQRYYLHAVKADTGIKVGPSFSGGVNIFLADFAALNLDVRDIMTYNNAAGLNSTTTDVPPKVDKQDANWNHQRDVLARRHVLLPRRRPSARSSRSAAASRPAPSKPLPPARKNPPQAVAR